MRISIITSGKQRSSLVLLYYLINRSLKPDSIIVVTSPLSKRIIRNFNYAGIMNLLKSILNRSNKYTREPKRDFLAEFVKKSNILMPESSLLKACKKEKVKYIKLNDILSKKSQNYIKGMNPDILINAGGGIFRSEIINSVRVGILNAHMGLLPQFRGMNALEWSLFNEEEIGVTLHFIDQGIDTGDILLFKPITIEPDDTIENLRGKAAVTNIEIITEGINRLKAGNLKGTKQTKTIGKQYFVMHHRLKMIVEDKLKKNYFLNKPEQTKSFAGSVSTE